MKETISRFTCIQVFMPFDKEMNSSKENSANLSISPRINGIKLFLNTHELVHVSVQWFARML